VQPQGEENELVLDTTDDNTVVDANALPPTVVQQEEASLTVDESLVHVMRVCCSCCGKMTRMTRTTRD
jgi:hypothetical protein